MELYFKDLISEEASLEKLVEDLSLLVHGADDYAKAVSAKLPEQSRVELANRLDGLKARCQRLKDQVVTGARATDRILRANPYASVGVGIGAGIGLGLLLGALFWRRG
jgi:ElaB/YqjD/DUF883 family membrane-anchored ribosome-binding protein